jgi:LAO/AO transport system kinase
VSFEDRALSGDRYALARVISIVEDGGPTGRASLAALYPHTGEAHVVGVTGAPGTGKSTLVNSLARAFRERDLTVGIIAVDPTSPYSGGALLGDRVRMGDLAGDPGVFVRSMATRGSVGGLARATSDVVKVLDAAGFRMIIVETVGAGQSELAIARAAHTVVVVEAPGMGDEVQALKAGLLEIADILVVNKADRPGAGLAARSLSMALRRDAASQTAADDEWRRPVLQTIALDGTGVRELADAVAAHGAYMSERGLWDSKHRERARAELTDALHRATMDDLRRRLGEPELDAWVSRVAARDVDPHTAAAAILNRWSGKIDPVGQSPRDSARSEEHG